MTAYFVTATGTDIGKTFVTAGLIRHLRTIGASVHALKPVVSGFDITTVASSDPGILLGALEIPFSLEALAHVSPWRFAAPLSPDMAAAREGKTLDFEALIALCRKTIAAEESTLFIEGVGGVMVPLNDRYTVLDWMVALDLPVILVAGSYLGTISHTLTALEVLSGKGIAVKALILNETANSSVSLEDTFAALRRFGPKMTVAAIRRVKRPLDAAENFAALWAAIV